MDSVLQVNPAAKFTLVTAFSFYAKVYNFNAVIIDVPRRPINEALRYTIFVNHEVICKTLSFSIPNFVIADAEQLNSKKDTLARKLLSYHFDICENTVATYISKFKSQSEPPANPKAYNAPDIDAGQRPYTRKWYLNICERFLVEKVSFSSI
jgi:hypothetical protein